MAELTVEQRERIRAQLLAHSGYICPDCLPTLSVQVTDDRWRLTVDHSPGCASYAERFLRAALDEPLYPEEERERDEQLARELGWDKPPTREQLAQWQRWAAMSDAEFEAEQGMTP